MENENPRSKSGTSLGMNEQFKKATVEMLVLYIIKDKPMYVYQITNELYLRSKDAFDVATLYPAMYRLTKFEYLVEVEMPKEAVTRRKRRYYQITESGLKHLSELLAEYEQLSTGVKDVLSYDPNKEQV